MSIWIAKYYNARTHCFVESVREKMSRGGRGMEELRATCQDALKLLSEEREIRH